MQWQMVLQVSDVMITHRDSRFFFCSYIRVSVDSLCRDGADARIT